MGFRWTISLVLLHFVVFLVFLSSVLFFVLVFLIGNWPIVYLLDIFLFVVFLYFSSYFPSLGFYCLWGPKSFGSWG